MSVAHESLYRDTARFLLDSENLSLTIPQSDKTKAHLTDWLVHDLAPIWLTAAGLTDHAVRLRALPPITAEAVRRPTLLRHYVSPARAAGCAVHYLPPASWPVPHPLGGKIRSLAVQAKFAIPQSKVGYWAYWCLSASLHDAAAAEAVSKSQTSFIGVIASLMDSCGPARVTLHIPDVDGADVTVIGF
jgi:hypothetical protein